MSAQPTTVDSSRLNDVLRKHEEGILTEWTAQLRAGAARRHGGMNDAELRDQAERFLRALTAALQRAPGAALDDPAWQDVHELLTSVSRSRAAQGYSPAETASFVLSLKKPMFAKIRQELTADPAALAADTWRANELLDSLGLHTMEIYIKGREELIRGQQQELLELSTPVVMLWDGILALPLIGTLDSARTQVVMENLLQGIVDTGAAIAIIDITGVPTVDTLVAQHLLKTVAAARLMGADCIISGIRPQIAQTIVHLGVEMPNVITKSTLAAAFAVAIQRLGLAVTPRRPVA